MVSIKKRRNIKDDTIQFNREMVLANNRGLSFVELIIAIVLLVIILGPVMKAIVSSMEINRQSRKMMTATDAGQAVLESVCGKSFDGLLNSYSGEATLTNGNQLAVFKDASGADIYNNRVVNMYRNTCSFGVNCDAGLDKVSLPLGGGSTMVYSTVSLARGGANDFSYKMLNAYGSLIKTGATPGDPKLYLYADCTDEKNTAGKLKYLSNSKVLFFGYTDVEYSGFKFDIIGYVIPAVPTYSATPPEFYPCTVRVAVYDAANNGGGIVRDCTTDEPILVLDSGIRRK